MRTLLSLCLYVSWLLLPGLVAEAADTHEGKVVSIEEGTGSADGKLVMTDKDGKEEHKHMISSSTKITRDNKMVKLGELKKGDVIKVTTNNDGKVTELAATPKASRNDAGGEAELPNFLSDLNLSVEQKDKIKNICRECEADRDTAWQDFGETYREAIGLEASMLSAIEENLTETQRKHIRHQRHKIAHRNQDSDNNSNKNSKDSAANNDQQNAKDRSTAVVEEITVIGVTLSPDQESATEGVRRNYFDRLRQLNSKLGDLHGQLVAMEAERLLKIEDVLTKEQRKQLRKAHQKITQTSSQSSSDTGSTK